MRDYRRSQVFHFILSFLFLLNPSSLFSGTMFAAPITSDEKSVVSQQELQQFDQRLSIRERKLLKETSISERHLLTPRLRHLHDERERLKEETQYWSDTSQLKRKFLALPLPPPSFRYSHQKREKEAEQMAQIAIRGFYELRQKYEMLRPPILHNFFVNAGLREEGFCWHWARDLTRRLREIDLQEYQLYWAVAREGRLREHNTVVISSQGRGLIEGLVLDGWRKAGKPFWILVSDDHYPWKEGEFYGEKE